MMVFSNIMIKHVFLYHDVLKTLDGINECVANDAFVLMFIMI